MKRICLSRAKTYVSGNTKFVKDEPKLVSDKEADRLLSVLDSQDIPYFKEVAAEAGDESLPSDEEASAAEAARLAAEEAENAEFEKELKERQKAAESAAKAEEKGSKAEPKGKEPKGVEV